MVTKTITIKKRGGGTRKQKVKVLRSGKFKFIKNSPRRVTVIGKGRKSRKTKPRRAIVKRVIRKVSRKSIMTRRRRSSTRRTSKSSGVMGTVKRFAKPIAIGLGIPAVLAIAGGAIGNPGIANNRLINAAGAFVLGGPVAGGAALLLGGGGGSLFGNGSNGGGGMSGFA